MTSFLFHLAGCKAVFANAVFSQRTLGPWGLFPGLRRLGWALRPRFPAGFHTPFCCLQESLDFPYRQRGSGIQLSCLGLWKKVV